MSFRSMFQDVRDAVDWVHYKVIGTLRLYMHLKLFLVFESIM